MCHFLTFAFDSDKVNLPPKTNLDNWNSRFQKARTKVRAFAFLVLIFFDAIDIIRTV